MPSKPVEVGQKAFAFIFAQPTLAAQ